MPAIRIRTDPEHRHANPCTNAFRGNGRASDELCQPSMSKVGPLAHLGRGRLRCPQRRRAGGRWSCDHKSLHGFPLGTSPNLKGVLESKELVARIIQDIERCKLGMCRTNEGNIKQMWPNALLTGTYMCATPSFPVEVDDHQYAVDEKTGLLLFELGLPELSPYATAATVIRRKLDDRVVIFSTKATDCYVREIAHEALHSVFRDHSHERITGPDGLENCVSCGGMSL
jgi:hypothetical protein